MPNIIGLKVHDDDNVAVVFSEKVKNGTYLDIKDHKGNVQVLHLLADVPYGHKVAIKDISVGSPILKYGEEIGVATSDIKEGDYVHVHNLDSQRGRGDKNN